jgi:hypothetical protein
VWRIVAEADATWAFTGEVCVVALVGVDPLKPIVETSPAAHITPIVRLRSRLGVSQLKLWVCSHDLKPVAAEAAAIAQPAHICSQ